MKLSVNAFFRRVVDLIIRVPSTELNSIHAKLIKQTELKENVFYTEHRRPKKSGSIKIKPHVAGSSVSSAIVLQGPLIAEDDFTFETVMIYKNNFPDSQLIVSTWMDEDIKLVQRMREAGAFVILNEKPKYAGISNINFQITSSINGIRKAKELGKDYVMKTRTDQRIYGLNVIDYFINLIRLFPLKNVGAQKERLIVTSQKTFLYRLYGISDMLMFGHIDDMMMYWNAPLDPRVFQTEQLHGLEIKKWATQRLCEVYLCTEFLKKAGKEIRWTLEDSWKVFADHFCAVDYSSIDLYWIKYDRHTEFRNTYYAMSNTQQLVNFKDWLALYYGKYRVPSEEILKYHEGESFELKSFIKK